VRIGNDGTANIALRAVEITVAAMPLGAGIVNDGAKHKERISMIGIEGSTQTADIVVNDAPIQARVAAITEQRAAPEGLVA
jgi:hypothetical protein